jgi:serine/threonine protein kinase
VRHTDCTLQAGIRFSRVQTAQCADSLPRSDQHAICLCSKHIIVHRDLKPANLMLGGIPHDTGTREMAAKVRHARHAALTQQGLWTWHMCSLEASWYVAWRAQATRQYLS